MISLAIFNPEALVNSFLDAAPMTVYLMVFGLMIIESSFIPFPSEVIVPPAAYLAATSHEVNIVAVVLIATAGALGGAMINYYLSVWIGRPLVYKFADSKIGHACLIDRAKVDKAEKYFDEHGAISTFMGRLIPVVRQLISIPAGLARMNIVKFAIFTSLGALIWNTMLAAMGMWLGHLVDRENLLSKVEEYNTYLTYGGIVLGIICVGFIIWNAFKTHK